MSVCVVFVLLCFCCLSLSRAEYAGAGHVVQMTQPGRKVSWLRFLVAANNTWGKCIASAASQKLSPGKQSDETIATVTVGKCLHGTLMYTIEYNNKLPMVNLTFNSSVEKQDRPLPGCTLPLRARYRIPTTQGPNNTMLDGCYIYPVPWGYWFYILQWMFV